MFYHFFIFSTIDHLIKFIELFISLDAIIIVMKYYLMKLITVEIFNLIYLKEALIFIKTFKLILMMMFVIIIATSIKLIHFYQLFLQTNLTPSYVVMNL